MRNAHIGLIKKKKLADYIAQQSAAAAVVLQYTE